MKQSVSTKWFSFSEKDFFLGKNMPKKNLEKLIAGIEVVGSLGDRNREIEHIAFDSRKVRQGSLFVAIPGKKYDGKTFLKEAVDKGAIAVIAQSSLKSLPSLITKKNNATTLCVEDSRKALSKISANYYGQPFKDLSLTGVTGTNGKTTLTYILEALSKADGRNTGVIGTIDCHFGETVVPSSITTPESLDLNRSIRKMVDAGVSDCFLEVSSHALSQKRVFEMSFEAGIFTNLSRDHLDFHDDMGKYKNAKAKLFRENLIKTSIINIDDPVGKEFAEEFKVNTITTGINNMADFYAENIVLAGTQSRFTLKTPSGSIDIKTNLLVRHNIYNLLSAAACASTRGISLKKIQDTFKEIPAIPGRFESVKSGQNFSVLVDYAHTQDALFKSISASKAFTRGEVIVVFGCGGDRDKGKRKEMGQVAIKNANFTVITSDNPRTEDPEKIIADILKGIPSNGPYKTITDRREAIAYAINRAKKNDLVLIAGKGHENYQVLGMKKVRFDDREVAREFLRNRVH